MEDKVYLEQNSQIRGSHLSIFNLVDSSYKNIHWLQGDEPFVSHRTSRSVDPFDQIYSHLHLLEGGATLIFAIDTTGSMSKDIHEAQQISQEIVNLPRMSGVDYMLSPFNDPGRKYASSF